MKQFLFGVLMALSSSAYSEYLWLDANLTGSDAWGGNTGLILNFSKNEHLYSIGFSRPYSSFSASDGDKIYSDTYLAYGRHFSTKWTKTSVSIGLGVVKEEVRENCDGSWFFKDCETDVKGEAVGIPIDAAITFGKYFGIGLNVHMNINEIKSSAGLGITFSYGKFN